MPLTAYGEGPPRDSNRRRRTTLANSSAHSCGQEVLEDLTGESDWTAAIRDAHGLPTFYSGLRFTCRIVPSEPDLSALGFYRRHHDRILRPALAFRAPYPARASGGKAMPRYGARASRPIPKERPVRWLELEGAENMTAPENFAGTQSELLVRRRSSIIRSPTRLSH